MKIVVPDYYEKFKCIDKRCKHNCCIGWEIDIDNDTYDFYIKEKITDKIIVENEIPHFILDENERCPYLNCDNLCDIILKYGEEKICNICKDHPRFRNYFSERVEMGIGLCCEEAGNIILSQNKINLITLYDDVEEPLKEEKDFFDLRDKIFEIIDEDLPFFSMCEKIFSLLDIKIAKKNINNLLKFYLTLEPLDNNWFNILKGLNDFDYRKLNISFNYRNILHYFVFRHLSDSVFESDIKERVIFSVVSTFIIASLCHIYELKKIDDIVEICRLYSSEIEYSEENINDCLTYFMNLSV